MVTECAIEQYQFSCARCGTQWIDEYDALLATDYDGETVHFHWHGGFSCEAPAAAEIVCRGCGCGPVEVKLISRRTLLAAERADRQPR